VLIHQALLQKFGDLPEDLVFVFLNGFPYRDQDIRRLVAGTTPPSRTRGLSISCGEARAAPQVLGRRGLLLLLLLFDILHCLVLGLLEAPQLVGMRSRDDIF
jgi:hypothetical protein